ncbi:PAS domain-containing protein [Fulvivirgaceae bacterium BMA12]|uniref:histidine kinase n=1 Tax=Agaribacillus aureus TaxID=3051825 RepID=A0ABT8L1N2_9BACT|nr:PAS domain-containing protein [Fulvivirgaceae bacterium BMA12]
MEDLNILILEDVTADAELIESALKKGKFAFDSKRVKTKKEFQQALKTFRPDLILADFDMLEFKSDTDTLEITDLKVPNTPFIVVSGESEELKARKILNGEIADYVLKDKLSKLPQVVRKALDSAKVHQKKVVSENALQESHDRLNEILSVAELVTWEWRIAENVVKFGNGLTGALGYEVEQNGFDFAQIKKIIHLDDKPEMLESLKAHIDGTAPVYSSEYRVRHKNGIWVWVSDKGKVTKTHENGKPTVVSGILKVTTASMEPGYATQLKGKGREKPWILLDTVYKTVPVAFTVLDHDFYIISANKVLSQLTGLPQADNVGKRFKDVVPEIARKSETFLRRVIKSGRPIFNFEIKGRTPVSENKIRHFLISFYPLKSPDYQIIGVAINDITTLKLAEAARFESEMRLHQLEENINAVVWMIEAGTNKLQYISSSCEKFWGLTIANLYDDPFSFLENVHPDEQEYVEEYMIKLLNSDKPGQFEIEFRIITRDKGIRWLSGRGFAIPDKSGGIKSYGGLMQDITKRKLAQMELEDSQNMLLETQKIVRLGSFKWTISENKVIWSDQLFRIFGYQPGQISTSIASYLRLSFSEDRKLLKKTINRSIVKKEGFELEHRIVLPDGLIRIVDLIVKVILGNDGVPVQLIGWVQDITDRKQAEEVAQRFGRILDSSLNELYIFKEDTMSFIQASKSALQNLGYSLEELKQLTPVDIQIGIDRDKMAEWISLLKSGEEEGIVFEGVNRRKDGSDYPIEARLQYLRSETPPVFLAEISDISQRRKAQEARYEGQEMERKRIAMEIHDGIGQMLIAIKQRVLNLDFKQVEKAELEEKIEEIDKILSMTIEEVRRTSNNLAPIVLKKMGIEDAIEMLCNQTAKISNIKILFDHKGPKIRASENILLAIYRILQEAMNNIVKHSGASQAKVQFFQDEKNISLIIADNGKGFDINGNIRKGSNGLSNMRERATLVNGFFYIETAENSGTYIKVDVPFESND